jgi:hypothetical protein
MSDRYICYNMNATCYVGMTQEDPEMLLADLWIYLSKSM